MHPLLGDEFLPTYDPLALSETVLNGVGYGLPYTYGNILVLYFNKKLVPGPPPATFDELVKVAQGLTKAEVPGLAFDSENYVSLLPFLDAAGGWPVDNAGKVTLDTTPMVKALQRFKDLNTAFKVSYDRDNGFFTNGRLPFMINGNWELSNYLNSGSLGAANLGIAPLPMIDGRAPARS